MISNWRRATFTACLAIGAVLFVLASSARADRDEGKGRRAEGYSRFSHWRSRHENGNRGRTRGAHRSGGSRESARGDDRYHRGERSYASREEGRGGRERAEARHRGGERHRGTAHHWAGNQEHGRRGHHRYASHARGGLERSGREFAHGGGPGGRWHRLAHQRSGRRHRGDGPDGGRQRRDRDGGHRAGTRDS
jgi:hypothetical protein